MALGKSSLLKMAAQAFKAGNCFNIFLNFGGFEAQFLIKTFLIKKTCIEIVLHIFYLNIFDEVQIKILSLTLDSSIKT